MSKFNESLPNNQYFMSLPLNIQETIMQSSVEFASEEERAENVNIGIAVRKGNTELKDAMDKVLSALNEEQFNALMDQAIANQPAI